MKILLLCHGYNCLTQRLHIELTTLGHQVSIEFDINDTVTTSAVDLFEPDLIIAPYLKRAIPENIWRNKLCWIIHPGIIGDRGPSSLDWAIINQESQWGVTVLQANEIMDGGDIWASASFAMPDKKGSIGDAKSKSSLYRNEVTDAASLAVKKALNNFANPDFFPTPLARLEQEKNNAELGQWRCLMSQAERKINWQLDRSATIIAKINCSDTNPGVKETFFNTEVYLYNATFDATLSIDAAIHADKINTGSIIAQSNGAIAVATLDGAVWISHLRIKPSHEKHNGLKLPAATVLAKQLSFANIKTLSPAYVQGAGAGYQEIYYRLGDCDDVQSHQENDTAYLYFDFYNGAMSTEQCQRLTQAYLEVCQLNVRTIVLMGGKDFWSNGIHLNVIENAQSSADESWQNINAMNDLCLAIINTTDKLTISLLRGNAGAGGVFLALTTDRVIAQRDVILNAHYKSMGNLYGSEYWTYLLPKRVGSEQAKKITNNRLPINSSTAKSLKLIDESIAQENISFAIAQAITLAAADDNFSQFLTDKKQTRANDEQIKTLAQYRAEELAQMKLNFYGFDPSYHVARYHFVYKLKKSRTPPYLALHRQAKFISADQR